MWDQEPILYWRLKVNGKMTWNISKAAMRGAARYVAVPVWLGLEMFELHRDFQSGDPEQLHSNKWVTAADWSWNSNPTSPYSGFNRWLDLVGAENPLETHVRY